MVTKEKKSEIQTTLEKTPFLGFYETRDFKLVNDLISSDEWFCKQVTENGVYILKRIKR